jgi:hypothetical protein
MKPKSRIVRKVKALGHEVMALIDQMVTEAVFSAESKAYRLKIPYKSIDPKDNWNDGNLVIDVAVYYDGEFKEEPDEQRKDYQITGPDKGRH